MRVPVRDTHDSLLRGKPRARTGNSIYFKFVGCSPRLAPPSCRAINRRRHLGKGAQIVACVLNAPLEHTHTGEGEGEAGLKVFLDASFCLPGDLGRPNGPQQRFYCAPGARSRWN